MTAIVFLACTLAALAISRPILAALRAFADRAASRLASAEPALREAAIRARRCWNGARLREFCGPQVPVPAQNAPTAAPKPRMRWDLAAGRLVPVLAA